MEDERVLLFPRRVRVRDPEPRRVLRVDLVRRQRRGLEVRVDEVPLVLERVVEELVGPPFHQDRLAPPPRVGPAEFLVLLVELVRHPQPDLEVLRHAEADVREELPRDLEPHHQMFRGLRQVRAQGVAVRHRERPEPPQGGQLPPLLGAERVPRELVQRERELLVRDHHVVRDQELAEAGAEAEERLLVRGLDDVLAGGEAVQVRLEGGVLEVVHDRALDLHRAVLHDASGDELLEEALDQPALRVEPQVPGVAPGLVVHELELPHEAGVRRFLLRLPRLGHLVLRELPEVLVPREVETDDLPAVQRERVDPAIRFEDEPARDELRLRLHRLRDVLPRRGGRADLPRELGERVALHAHAERLVVPERGREDLEPALRQALVEEREDLFRGGRRREGRAQVGVRVDRDPRRLHLGRDLLDVPDGLLRDALEIRLVLLLRADEADEGVLNPALSLLGREVLRGGEGLLPHLVFEEIAMEEQHPHRGPRNGPSP